MELEGFIAIVVGSDWLVNATAENGLKEHPMAGFSVSNGLKNGVMLIVSEG